ncbi:hypothetical protein SSIL_1441 [Solibacillus silvestris StLB046]|uniref:Uncharacterized protein n=1 Tax=Solibacillus silvestris (strain StLB046) TaxID=1002809 RepID=F2F2M6_SOLSS|nr:hypothetical protein [Solibacillus silvestris]BAK15864.1 hypothetical protein SSIL_1441 [Solibacillus silvestris StLB046]
MEKLVINATTVETVSMTEDEIKALEKTEGELLYELLNPSTEDIQQAEFEIKVITLLMDMGVI